MSERKAQKESFTYYVRLSSIEMFRNSKQMSKPQFVSIFDIRLASPAKLHRKRCQQKTCASFAYLDVASE